MMKFLKSLALFSLIILSTGCSKPAVQKKPPVVEIAEAIQRDTPIFIESIGNVYSLQTVQVRPQVGGIITEAYVKQGQYVKKGDKLYQIDPRPYQAALDQAKAALLKDTSTLTFNQSRVDRYAAIVKKEFLSKLDYESFQNDLGNAKAQVLSDQANIAIAALNLEWATPLSPIDGKISQYNIDPGNLVVANDANALTNIRQIDPIDIRFSITQSDFLEVQNEMRDGSLKFLVYLPQDPKKPREGTTYFIDNSLDLNTGTVLIRGTAPNKDEMFWPGEFVRVKLQKKLQKGAILVPEEAVSIGQKGPFVYIYHPETSEVEYRLVEKGETLDRFTVIEKGVNVGDQVVIKGQVNVRPNGKVTVVTSSDKKTSKKGA